MIWFPHRAQHLGSSLVHSAPNSYSGSLGERVSTIRFSLFARLRVKYAGPSRLRAPHRACSFAPGRGKVNVQPSRSRIHLAEALKVSRGSRGSTTGFHLSFSFSLSLSRSLARSFCLSRPSPINARAIRVSMRHVPLDPRIRGGTFSDFARIDRRRYWLRQNARDSYRH